MVCLRGMTVSISVLAGWPQSVAHHLYTLLPIMVKEESDLYETYTKVAREKTEKACNRKVNYSKHARLP